MFDARLLSVFREVATRGSFSDAATALSSQLDTYNNGGLDIPHCE